MNDRVKMTAREPTRVGANRLRTKGLIKEKGFEIEVKQM